MLKEFKEFAMRGNVMDLAIAVVIGGAFGKIVTSFVNDILMPPLGLLLGGLKFDNYFIVLKGGAFATLEEAQAAGAITWNYGSFITTIVDFLIVAFAIFLVMRQINRLQRQEEAPPPEPTTKQCPHCFTDIPIKATRCPNCTTQLT